MASLARAVGVTRHHGHGAHRLAASSSLHLHKTVHESLGAVERSAAAVACCDRRAGAVMARGRVLLRARLHFAAVKRLRTLAGLPVLLRAIADHDGHADALHAARRVLAAGCSDIL